MKNDKQPQEKFERVSSDKLVTSAAEKYLFMSLHDIDGEQYQVTAILGTGADAKVELTRKQKV